MDAWRELRGPLRSTDERVIGTYLYPYRVFLPADWEDPYSAAEVVATATVEEHAVLITRNGGLFVRPPSDLPLAADEPPEQMQQYVRKKIAFEERAVGWFNRLICEFALLGVVSEPASPALISKGKLINNHALITGGSGGRELYLERTANPGRDLIGGGWPSIDHDLVPEETLKTAVSLERASKLAEVSQLLPTLTAGAYSAFSRRQISEATADAWFACEQMLDYIWRNYVSSVPEGRRGRLKDTRIYTAAVRTEVLHSVGLIDEAASDALHKARDLRNKLAHRAQIDFQAALICMEALEMMIELLCETKVEQFDAGQGVNW